MQPCEVITHCKICGIKLEFPVPVYSRACSDLTGLRMDTGKPDFAAIANTHASCPTCEQWAYLETFCLIIRSGYAWAPEVHHG